jgi:hypothetical protein
MRTLPALSLLLLVSCSGKLPKDEGTPPDDSAADTEVETGIEDTGTGGGVSFGWEEQVFLVR